MDSRRSAAYRPGGSRARCRLLGLALRERSGGGGGPPRSTARMQQGPTMRLGTACLRWLQPAESDLVIPCQRTWWGWRAWRHPGGAGTGTGTMGRGIWTRELRPEVSRRSHPGRLARSDAWRDCDSVQTTRLQSIHDTVLQRRLIFLVYAVILKFPKLVKLSFAKSYRANSWMQCAGLT